MLVHSAVIIEEDIEPVHFHSCIVESVKSKTQLFEIIYIESRQQKIHGNYLFKITIFFFEIDFPPFDDSTLDVD